MVDSDSAGSDVERSSHITTRTAILVATTTSTQGDHPDVSRPTAEDHGEPCRADVAVRDEGRMDNVEVLQSARLWNHKTVANADPWEAAVRHFPIVSVSSCFLLETEKGCPQPSLFDDSVFGEYIGSLVQNTTGVWEPAVRTDVSQHRCRVINRSPWWELSCDDDVWLHEQATMNRAQNLFVDEQFARIQTNRDESCCYFADHRIMQIRPASTYDLARSNRICLMDLRDAPACEYEAICQHVKTMQPYVMVVQQNNDGFSDEEIRTLYNQQVNQGGDFLLNMGGSPKEQIRLGTSVWVFASICLVSSGRLPNQERIFTFTTSLPDVLRKPQWSLPLLDSNELDRRDDRTGLSSPLGQRIWLEHLERADRKKAERINQELQEKLCQTFQFEAAIDFACDQDRVLREHFPQVARGHREEILPPELEDIYEPRRLEPEEEEDDETETARALSEREKREPFRQHGNLGHPLPAELARAVRHAGARREATRFVLKELRCPSGVFPVRQPAE